MNSRVATLDSIELAGFKSFAKRTKINFGNGLVAIVGPNGSGKSNITDAIRWAFGEQRTRSLRTDKSEDLIFHGGKNKPRASMAEVIIRLNNSSRAIPIDLDEIEITRRLYRNGESNYLLNGRKASLASIQEILASSGFGVGSYTVIGQGMIDKLVLSSSNERKRLFEEASGIKQYEIKLSKTQKRINKSLDNLKEIDLLISDLKPRHEDLIRQQDLLLKKNALTKELLKAKSSYIIYQKNTIDSRIKKMTISLSGLNKNHKELSDELNTLEKSSRQISKHNSKKQANKLNDEILYLENNKTKMDSEINLKISKIEGLKIQINEIESSKNHLKKELKENLNQLNKHKVELKKIEAAVSKLDDKISEIDKKISFQTKSLDDTRRQLMKSQRSEYLKHSLGLIDILQDGIKRNKNEEELGIVFYKLRRMIKHSISDNSAELAMKVGKIQNIISRLLDERENINELQTNQVIKLRAIEMDSAIIDVKIKDIKKSISGKKNNELLKTNAQAIKSIEKDIAKTEIERDKIIKSIAQNRDLLVELAQSNNDLELDAYYQKHEKITNQLTKVTSEINTIESELKLENEKLSDLNKTQSLWFPYSTPKINKSHNVTLQEITRLEAELEMLEEINPEVEKEAEESASKMQYLSEQHKDLTKALDDLQKVAVNTQNKMQAVFKRNFKLINNNFNDNFRELFGGGSAELKLIAENDEFGVDIFVKLPNKNSQNISSLSGGEKSLSSVALLSGILLANPSPFVVLDEVDAALDEENTRRFAKVISKITKHSQVLVVTHNHETMMVADELLGVTTSGNNESNIISVELSNYPAEAQGR